MNAPPNEIRPSSRAEADSKVIAATTSIIPQSDPLRPPAEVVAAIPRRLCRSRGRQGRPPSRVFRFACRPKGRRPRPRSRRLCRPRVGAARAGDWGCAVTSEPPAEVDLLALTPRERRVWDRAFLSGHAAGFESGARWADERAASIHYEAVRMVRRLAGMPEVDPEECRRRAAARERRWSA